MMQILDGIGMIYQKSDLENKLFHSDSLQFLKQINDNQINLSVFSPAYWKQRDYEFEGQMGMEKTPEEFNKNLIDIIRELYRITTLNGSIAINIGDTIKNKFWTLIPETVALVCKSVGFGCVSKIIWYKTNAMPSSTKLRWSPKWEPIYIFAKSKDWYFDLDSIRIPVKTKYKEFNYRARDSTQKKFGILTNRSDSDKEKYDNKSGIYKKQDNVKGSNGEFKSNYKDFNGRYDHKIVADKGKNPGDVWVHSNQRNKKKHPAVFPDFIPRPIIKAMTVPGDLVMDPFCGSGTTCLAAQQEGRNYLGIDLNSNYIEEASQWLSGKK